MHLMFEMRWFCTPYFFICKMLRAIYVYWCAPWYLLVLNLCRFEDMPNYSFEMFVRNISLHRRFCPALTGLLYPEPLLKPNGTGYVLQLGDMWR